MQGWDENPEIHMHRRRRSVSPIARPFGDGMRGGRGRRGGRGARGHGMGRGGGGRGGFQAPPMIFGGGRARSLSRSRSRSPGGRFGRPQMQIPPSIVSASASQSETSTEPATASASPVKPPPILTRSKSLAELIKETAEASHDVLMQPPPEDAETVEIAEYKIPELPPQEADDDTALLLTDALDITGMDFSLEISDEMKESGLGEEKKDDSAEDERKDSEVTSGSSSSGSTSTTNGSDNSNNGNKKKKPMSDMEKMELFSERTRQRCLRGLLYDSRFSSDLVVRCTIPNSTFVKTWRVNRTFFASCSALFDSMLFPEQIEDRRLRAKGKLYSCELLLDGTPEGGQSITPISSPDASNSALTSSAAHKTDAEVSGLDDDVEYIEGVPVLDLGEIQAQFVEIIIRHAYFCDPKIPIDSAYEMLVVCQDFGLKDLMKDCNELLDDITPEGVCSLLSQAMKYDIKSLQINCINHIESDFRKKQMDRMFASKTFREMPVQCLVALVKSDLLRVKEEELFSHCLVWAETQSKIMLKRRLKQAKAEAGIEEYGLDEVVEIIPKDTPKKKKADESGDKEDEKKEEDDTVGDGESTATKKSSSSKEEVKLDDSALIDQLLPNAAAQEALKSVMSSNIEEKGKTEAMKEDGNDESTTTDGGEKKKSEDIAELGDELLIQGSEAYDGGQFPVLGTNGKPLITARDFLEEIKYFIRFPVMEPSFIATIVNKTGLFTEAEEYRIVKSILLKDSQLAKPFIRYERRSAGDFASSIHFVRGRGSSSWSYSGSKDCIEVTSNMECHLVGIGLWCGDHGSDAHVEIFRGRNEGGDRDSRRVLNAPEQAFEMSRRNDAPIPFVFPEPFEMEARQLYTIELHQLNREGGQSMQTESDGWGTAMTSVTHGGVTLTFSDAADSPNGTDTGSGAFPVFYICT